LTKESIYFLKHKSDQNFAALRPHNFCYVRERYFESKRIDEYECWWSGATFACRAIAVPNHGECVLKTASTMNGGGYISRQLQRGDLAA
jgi:hypothetical protein